ncbi:MAG TPA: XRE family transcriptional regulator [Clostridiales bacterium]|nr:XRE family transcriptional regulator [Clostridiales bacterium]
MNNRIFEIRKHFKLSQEKFATAIGMTGAGISKIESGDRGITEQTIKSICREFDINEEWLRSGEGEMFNSYATEDKFGKAMDLIFKDADPFIRNMIIEMASLPQEEKETMKKAIAIIKKITSK